MTVNLNNLKIGYGFFLVGVIQILLLQGILVRISGLLSDEVNEIDRFEAECKRHGVAFYSDIDLDIESVDSMTPRWVKVLSAGTLIFLLGWLVFRDPSSETFPYWYTHLLILVFGFLSPMLYSFAGVAELGRSESKRDEYMARRINDLAKDDEYNRVLVSCGDSHVEGIAEKLRNRGWSVETHRSNHKILRRIRI